MIQRSYRFSIRDFPEKADRFFSGKFILAKRVPNRLEHNRYAAAISAGRIKKAAERHLLKRRTLARAAKLPDAGSDILFVVLSAPGSKHELDAEFDRIRTAL
jgi:ribonuclease P protein component